MADIAEKTPRRTGRLSSRSIPPALIYEMWNGKPIYYRGYRDVLAGKKTVEKIRASTDLQGVLVALLIGQLAEVINRKVYCLATNRLGLRIALNDNLASDVAISKKKNWASSKASTST